MGQNRYRLAAAAAFRQPLLGCGKARLDGVLSSGAFGPRWKAFGAFDGSRLVGFAAVDSPVAEGYASLSLLFVDDQYKRQGLGSVLFRCAAAGAKELGANRLFISSIPSKETVAFYFAMGCTDAVQCIPAFVDSETNRCLELPLN